MENFHVSYKINDKNHYARVKSFNNEKNEGIADYYYNFELFASNKKFILKDDDVTISEEEFNKNVFNE